MKPPVKREWPKYAVGPQGNRARFNCRGDVPHGWTVEGEAPAVALSVDASANVVTIDAAPKNKGGRPKKAVAA